MSKVMLFSLLFRKLPSAPTSARALLAASMLDIPPTDLLFEKYCDLLIRKRGHTPNAAQSFKEQHSDNADFMQRVTQSELNELQRIKRVKDDYVKTQQAARQAEQLAAYSLALKRGVGSKEAAWFRDSHRDDLDFQKECARLEHWDVERVHALQVEAQVIEDAQNRPLILVYATLLYEHGAQSQKVQYFRNQHKDNEAFMFQAGILEGFNDNPETTRIGV